MGGRGWRPTRVYPLLPDLHNSHSYPNHRLMNKNLPPDKEDSVVMKPDSILAYSNQTYCIDLGSFDKQVQVC